MKVERILQGIKQCQPPAAGKQTQPPLKVTWRSMRNNLSITAASNVDLVSKSGFGIMVFLWNTVHTSRVANTLPDREEQLDQECAHKSVLEPVFACQTLEHPAQTSKYLL